MTTHLLDSDVIINYFAKNQEAVAKLSQIGQLEAPAVSVLTLVEVKIGVKDAQVAKVDKFFNALKIIPVIEETAKLAVEFIRSFGKKGKVLHLVDACIAATAISNDLILVTNNKKDYPMEAIRLL